MKRGHRTMSFLSSGAFPGPGISCGRYWSRQEFRQQQDSAYARPRGRIRFWLRLAEAKSEPRRVVILRLFQHGQ